MLTELIDGLIIGGWHDARNASCNATARGDELYIVTVAADSEFIGHECFHLVDGPGNSPTEFRAAVEAVCRARRAGKRVLVHCVGGRSRSAAVIVAAATVLTGRPLCDVYDELLRKHDCTGHGARIHPHLAAMLLEYEV